MKADLNLIDFDVCGCMRRRWFSTCPPTAADSMQRADGYKFTIVSGKVTFEDGQPTGEMPGKLIRGPQAGANT